MVTEKAKHLFESNGVYTHVELEARHEIEDLRIQIDKDSMQRQINEITESDYFQNLLDKVNEVRSEFDE